MALTARPLLAACLILLALLPASAAPRAAEAPGSLPGLPQALIPGRVLSANPFEAVAALPAGTRFDFITTQGEAVRAKFVGFSPVTGLIRFADGRGRTLEKTYEAFLASVQDGSLSFAAGKDAPYNTDVPARYHARLESVLAALRRGGIDVVWENDDHRDWRGLVSRERAAGFELPAYYAPTAADEFGNRRPTLFLRERATLGDLVREAGIASSWRRGALASGDLRDRLDAISHSRGRPASPAASRLALGYTTSLRDAEAAWDASYDPARRGDLAPRQEAQRLALEAAVRLDEELSGLAREDPHRADLAEVQARLEAWVYSLPVRRERPGFRLAPRAPAPAASGSPASAASWKWYADSFHRKTLANATRLRHVYLAAKKAGDPHIRFLEELGYRFEPEVVIPPLERIFRAYNERIDALIAAGTVRPSEVLRPARAFRTRAGAFLFLPYGAEIPRGASPYESLLPEEEVARMAAEGTFVLGESLNSVTLGDHSALEHDLGHLSGFLADPRYMAAVRRAYARVHSRALPLRDAEGDFTPLRNRLYHLVEYLSVLPPEGRPELLRLLDLPPRLARAGLLTVDAVVDHLRSAAPAEQARLREVLRGAAPRLVRHLGGGARDIVVREVTGEDALASVQAGHSDSLDALWRRALREARPGRAFSEDAAVRRRDLARLIVGLLESAKVDPERLLDEASQEQVSPDSSLYRWLCLTGLHEADRVSESVCH